MTISVWNHEQESHIMTYEADCVPRKGDTIYLHNPTILGAYTVCKVVWSARVYPAGQQLAQVELHVTKQVRKV
jgi:hypothetical protein